MDALDHIQSIIDLCSVTWVNSYNSQLKLRWWQWHQRAKREAEMESIMTIWRAAEDHRYELQRESK